MHGDFSLDPLAHAANDLLFLQQQGRVHLDSDWNQQMSALVDSIRTAVDDILGGDAAVEKTAFAIAPIGAPPGGGLDFTIVAGSFYVDGYRCTAPVDVSYTSQLYRPKPLASPGRWIAYLDVWVRQLTYHADPAIREVALGGPDTVTRGVVTWQVKVADLNSPTVIMAAAGDDKITIGGAFTEFAAANLDVDGTLEASVVADPSAGAACLDDRQTGYLGPANQTYRVEVLDIIDADRHLKAFSWDRDNGSVVWPITWAAGASIRILAGPGSLPAALDYVELVDETSALSGVRNRPWKVASFDPESGEITLAAPATLTLTEAQITERRPILRRWVGVVDVEGAVTSFDLEQGLKVDFSGGTFRIGDYWMISVRTTGEIVRPRRGDDSAAGRPHGVAHHYAPLALIDASAVPVFTDCRRVITPAAG